MNLATVLTELARSAPDRPIITVGSTTVRRQWLESQANRLARTYRDLGVRAGELVVLALPNGIEFFAACHAIWKLGAIPVPTSHKLSDREFHQIVELADPALIVGRSPEPDSGHPAVRPGFTADPSIDDAPLPVPPPARAWRVSTSGGSTGRPKLIVAAQSAIIEPRFAERLRIHPDQVQLVCGPLYHSAPFAWATLGLSLGHHLVVLPRFDADDALRAIEHHRVQWACLVPTMMLRMARSIDDAGPRHRGCDLSSLETVWHMAAPCPAWLKQRWIDLVGPDTLWEAYAGAEGLAMTVINGADWLEHRGSVGRAVSGEIKIVDGTGSDAPPGTVGEVYLRAGPDAATYRYIGADASALGDGWETIGDLGWMDEQGYLYLTDRKTDMILVGGANIYPAEVEGAILEHASVSSCAVVGLPDEDLGQRLHAVVQADDGLTADELRAFLEQRLARTKLPRSFRFVAHSLRDDAGKLRRSAVLAEEKARLVSAGPLSPDAVR